MTKKRKMEYLHSKRGNTMRELLQAVAENDPTLEELSGRRLGMPYGSDFYLALGHALQGNTHLSGLLLQSVVLTEEAAHALAQGMAQSNIESLTLNGFVRQSRSEQGRHDICDIFYRGIQAATTIQVIVLNQSLMTDDPGNAWRETMQRVPSIEIFWPPHLYGYAYAFSEVLTRATLLRKLTVWFKEVIPDDVTILAQGLYQNTSLTSLRFENVGVNSQDIQIIFAQGLNPNSSITKLDASSCLVDDGTIELLVDRWLPNCPMKDLDLEFNEIGLTGAQCLIRALAAYPTMLKLNLLGNSSIGYEGLRMIGNELVNLHHLTHLNLKFCSFWNHHAETDSEEGKTQASARQQAEEALVDGIKHNHSITDLMVGCNNFSPDVLDEISFYSILNEMGRYLLTSTEEDHGLGPSVWCHIFENCQRFQPYFAISVMFFYLKELPTLVQSHPC